MVLGIVYALNKYSASVAFMEFSIQIQVCWYIFVQWYSIFRLEMTVSFLTMFYGYPVGCILRKPVNYQYGGKSGQNRQTKSFNTATVFISISLTCYRWEIKRASYAVGWCFTCFVWWENLRFGSLAWVFSAVVWEAELAGRQIIWEFHSHGKIITLKCGTKL